MSGPIYEYLDFQSVVKAGVSDHSPVINGPIMTFNIMMQGKYRERDGIGRYNNGFGMAAETQDQYHRRLKHIVAVIAESVDSNPGIHIIAIQEGPVLEADKAVFLAEFEKVAHLRKFLPSLQKHGFSSWGVALLIDSERYSESVVETNPVCESRPFKDRVCQLALTDRATEVQFEVTTLHAPFDVIKSFGVGGLKTLLSALSTSAFIVGDFNIDPTLLMGFLSQFVSVFAPRDNSLLIESRGLEVLGHALDTVDGVIARDVLAPSVALRLSERTLRSAKSALALFSCVPEAVDSPVMVEELAA